MTVTETPVTLVTNSEMETYKACKRQWWLAYVRRLRHRTDPDSGPAARVGTLYHKVMEVYYDGEQSEESQRRALATLDNVPPLATVEERKEYAKAQAMAEGYFEWLAETAADADFTFEKAEERLQVASPVPGVDLLGKADLLGTRISSGEKIILDHKTTAAFGRSLVDIHLLRQPRLYSLMRRILMPDDPLHGVIWNMARSTARGPRSKPPYYMRYELALNDEDLRRYWRELDQIIRDMLETREKIAAAPLPQVVAYPTPSKDCSWKCPFYQVCGYLDNPKYDSEQLINDSYETYDPLERYDGTEVEI